MRPGRRLLLLLGAWLALALGLALLRVLAPEHVRLFALLWWLAGAALVCAAVLDFRRRTDPAAVRLVRQLPETLAVNVPNEARLTLHNGSGRSLDAELADDPPPHIEMPGLPARLLVPPGQHGVLRYHVIPRRRGDATFGAPWLRCRTPWRLWEFRLRPGDGAVVKVFPNFVPISRIATLGLEREIGAMGVHLTQRRGEGMDFHQLREFRVGDSLRQVDWKATARYRKPISREYQEERDQDILFLLDCGRRMRAHDGELSHFDHALNALLVTAQVGLRQGDAVGLMTFAVGERGAEADAVRWLPPVKSQTAINRVVQQLYDLHSTTATSDFLEAAQRLLERHRKRAMVILVSNVREEDAEDLRAAVRLLARRHRVVVASLREQALEERLEAPVGSDDDALGFLGTVEYVATRDRILRQLRQLGLSVIDTLPRRLHTELVAEYLRLKRSGAI